MQSCHKLSCPSIRPKQFCKGLNHPQQLQPKFLKTTAAKSSKSGVGTLASFTRFTTSRGQLPIDPLQGAPHQLLMLAKQLCLSSKVQQPLGHSLPLGAGFWQLWLLLPPLLLAWQALLLPVLLRRLEAVQLGAANRSLSGRVRRCCWRMPRC